MATHRIIWEIKNPIFRAASDKIGTQRFLLRVGFENRGVGGSLQSYSRLVKIEM